MRFLIITPAKNEGEYIEGLIISMIAQEIKPAAWVIVDDGSTDNMVEIIEKYAASHPWIKVMKKDSSAEERSGGAKVVRAFNRGYAAFKQVEHDVVMKLDADLTLPDNYLKELTQAFRSDDALGLCGGYCAIEKNGHWEPEVTAAHHVRGALKAYSKRCFQAIGGLKETWNWDGLDIMMVMHGGWKVKVLELMVKHHRPTSAAYEPVQHAFRSGQEAYRTGDDYGLALIRSLFKSKQRPYLKCGMAYMKGYVQARNLRTERVVSTELAAFIRRFQYKRILSLNRLGHGM